MPIAITQVDAFTDRPFAGNPAAVCILRDAPSEEWMQNVAREVNLAETAFLQPREDGYDLRWFTPAVEVDLCGHATLASAHVLWETGVLDTATPARFHTRSGLLVARRNGDEIELDFPATPAEAVTPPDGLPDGLIEALGAVPVAVAKSRFDYLAELESEDAVRKLQPDLRALAKLPVRGVMATARGNGRYDFVSRFFAPAVGIDEDPVTGSAHCCLGPYWQERVQRDEFLAYQASARGGEIRVKVAGDRVFLSGKAVTVLRGELV
jgi:PhzF family phenazine biosynthesis protein